MEFVGGWPKPAGSEEGGVKRVLKKGLGVEVLLFQVGMENHCEVAEEDAAPQTTALQMQGKS